MDLKSRLYIINGILISTGLGYSGLIYCTITNKKSPLINKTFDSILYGSGITLCLIPIYYNIIGINLLKG